MASLGKREFAKRDMNFFSEFAASSQASARMIRNMIIGGIVILGILVAVIFFLLAKLGITNSEIKAYDEKFKSEEYVNAQSKAVELANKSAKINRHAYTVSQMDATVKRETGASFEILRHLESHIPNDMIVTAYELDRGSVKVSGQTLNYYTPDNFANMLNENDIFYRDPDVSVERVDPKDLGEAATFLTNYLNAKYVFEIVAPLDVQYMVTVSQITSDNVIISVPENQLYDPNSKFEKSEISHASIGGTNYDLASISINGQAVTKEELDMAINSDTFAVYVNGDLSIEFTYTEVVAQSTEEAK